MLVGGLEHVFFHILGMSSSQLTKSIVFQRGRLNHQPDMVYIDGYHYHYDLISDIYIYIIIYIYIYINIH